MNNQEDLFIDLTMKNFYNSIKGKFLYFINLFWNLNYFKSLISDKNQQSIQNFIIVIWIFWTKEISKLKNKWFIGAQREFQVKKFKITAKSYYNKIDS